jgi:hypothetical protein
MVIDDDDNDDDGGGGGAFPRRARVAYCKYKLVPTEHLRRREQEPEREDVRVNAAPDVMEKMSENCTRNVSNNEMTLIVAVPRSKGGKGMGEMRAGRSSICSQLSR